MAGTFSGFWAAKKVTDLISDKWSQMANQMGGQGKKREICQMGQMGQMDAKWLPNGEPNGEKWWFA
jgi:hypothetical protein